MYAKYAPATRSVDYYEGREYIYNAKGQLPHPDDVKKIGADYIPETMFCDYDSSGFDKYGYSAYDTDGNYVGPAGGGVDMYGYTEQDYLLDEDKYFLCLEL
jgi:hypothetical protein